MRLTASCCGVLRLKGAQRSAVLIASCCGLLHLVAAHCVARAPSGAPSRALAPGRPAAHPHPSRRIDCCGSLLRLVAAHVAAYCGSCRLPASRSESSESRPRRRIGAAASAHRIRVTASASPPPSHRLRVASASSHRSSRILSPYPGHRIRVTARAPPNPSRRLRVAASEPPREWVSPRPGRAGLAPAATPSRTTCAMKDTELDKLIESFRIFPYLSSRTGRPRPGRGADSDDASLPPGGGRAPPVRVTTRKNRVASAASESRVRRVPRGGDAPHPSQATRRQIRVGTSGPPCAVSSRRVRFRARAAAGGIRVNVARRPAEPISGPIFRVKLRGPVPRPRRRGAGIARRPRRRIACPSRFPSRFSGSICGVAGGGAPGGRLPEPLSESLSESLSGSTAVDLSP